MYIYLLFHLFAFLNIIFYPSCHFLAVRGEPFWLVFQIKFGKEVQKTQDSPRSPPGNKGREENWEREEWRNRGRLSDMWPGYQASRSQNQSPGAAHNWLKLPVILCFHQNSDRTGVSQSFGTWRWPKVMLAGWGTWCSVVLPLWFCCLFAFAWGFPFARPAPPATQEGSSKPRKP